MVASTLEALYELGLKKVASGLEEQLGNPSDYVNLSFEDRLAILFDPELTERRNKSIQKLKERSAMVQAHASMESIEYLPERHLSKAELQRYSTCEFIKAKHHLIIKGATGTGKTFLSCALGDAACRHQFKVYYVRMPDLLKELKIARTYNTFDKCMRFYKRPDLLIIDEWLLKRLTYDETFDLLELIEARLDNKKPKEKNRNISIIFCTHYDQKSWYNRLCSDVADPDERNPICDSVLDRIVTNAYDITLSSNESLRKHFGICQAG